MADRTGKAAEVLQVLADGDEQTVAEVADRLGLSASTVSKVLAGLEADGRVRRAPGGRDAGRRLPDRWSAVPPKEDSAAAKRLPRGALAGQVLDHLTAHRGVPFTATAVAKALGGRSAGAVANALARLTDAGQIRQVGNHPRRYAAPS